MSQEKDAWDIAESGDLSEMTRFIESYVSLIDENLKLILANLDKTERNTVLYNLLLKLRLYLHCLMSSLMGPTEQLGFATRSLFELNLITRYVLMSEENLRRFVAESMVDMIQIFEGLSEAAHISSKEDVRIYEQEIARSKAFAKKHNLPLKKPNPIRDIAKVVGLELEYKALYKLFSKCVHPSSYSINVGSQELLGGDRLRVVFFAFALLYAGDTFQRIKEAIMGGVV